MPHNRSNSNLAALISAGEHVGPRHVAASGRQARRGGTLRRRWAEFRSWAVRSERMRDLVSFQVSLVVHCALLLVLAMWWIHEPRSRGIAVVVAPARQSDGPPQMLDLSSDSSLAELAAVAQSPVDASDPVAAISQLKVPSPLSRPVAGGQPRPAVEQIEALTGEDLLLISEAPTGGGMQGRTRGERARLAAARGGSAASEDAVELALAWLAAHQASNGSWRLDHNAGPCNGQCRDPGQTLETAIGATGLALLPFLGAGYTHQQGPYQEQVESGLQFLMNQMKQTEHGGDLQWDTTVGMYAQGIATLALCEAYAMTGDKELERYAQMAVDFICHAQHPRGGWRYLPQQPGDTTVTGWQIMALKSARLGHLFVPSPVTERTKAYLNSVQDGHGAFYGYLRPDKQPGTTAVGLLLRMYLGWTRQDERLERGVAYLYHRGPSSSDMYYNYYATQVLHHYEGSQWQQWNTHLRDYLIAQQAKDGHERGSWFFADPHGSVGGRHYTTAICAMILEVYYRYMPLYGERATEDF